MSVAIDRAPRFVPLAVKDNETGASAISFLDKAVAYLPFPVTHMLTDRGSCFTADAFEATCRHHEIEHRKTRSDTPKTSDMVERFKGRVRREVLGITIYSHQDLEILPVGFNGAYKGRPQRALKSLSPERVLHQRPKSKPALARPTAKKPDPTALHQALNVVADAKDVSHQAILAYNSLYIRRGRLSASTSADKRCVTRTVLPCR